MSGNRKPRPYTPRKSTTMNRVLRSLTAYRELIDSAQEWLMFLDQMLSDLAIRRNSLLSRMASPNSTAAEMADLQTHVNALDIQYSDTWGLYQQFTLREPKHAATFHTQHPTVT